MQCIEVPNLLNAHADIPELCNELLELAVRNHASDIHLTYQANGLHLSLRMDGQLEPQGVISSLETAGRITNHIKIISALDVGERRRPQSGRAMIKVDGRAIDLRVSALPTNHGQDIVIRILDRSVSLLDVAQLGMSRRQLNHLLGLTSSPNGLILVTGATGAGKTTTLYALLQRLNDGSRKIITIENPIEYDLEGINQTQVNEKIGVDYGVLLRTVLQQDPNVIMVGEVRDPETAAIAVRAAVTGHLVFATMHAISASAAVESMISLGAHPHFLSRALRGVVAQTLVRCVCEPCKQRIDETASVLPLDDIRDLLEPGQEPALSAGRGCDVCHGSGYRGRMGLFEILVADEKIQRLVENRASAEQLHDAAVDAGMLTMQQVGKLAAFMGRTTVEELVRMVIMDFRARTGLPED